MQAVVNWVKGMRLEGSADDHTVQMDAKSPIGENTAASPKELVMMGLGGCTAMDVIALMKKHKQPLSSLRVSIDIQSSVGAHPVIFEKVVLIFEAEGEIDHARLLEAVKLSQTKYCGVSAMLSKAVPISYRVVLNGKEIGSGLAQFEPQQKEGEHA